MADHRADTAFARALRTLTCTEGASRVETDSLVSKEIPADAYWGINVIRALDNFAISGRPISVYADLIFGFACVKQAAARANAEIGVLDREKADLIDRACEEIKDGRLHDQFIVDIMQGGAGTSTNMNANEVIANRGLELAGHVKGDYQHLDPNDQVNRSQSTNDSYPTALKIGLCLSIERMLVEVGQLAQAFRDKGRDFHGILKVGRTQLQDAVPMTLEQEFAGFADTVAEDHASFETVMKRLWETNLGATAIGTGIAADPRYADAVRVHLAGITGYDIVTAPNLVEATTDVGVFMELSGTLKRSAMKLSKICNDLRLLSSGPQAGLGEINAAAPGGIEQHAGQGQPCDPGGRQRGRVRCRGRRRDAHDGRTSRAAPAERVRPRHDSRAVREPAMDDGRDGDARRELRPRHHRQHGAARRSDRIVCRRDHRAHPAPRVWRGLEACQDSARDKREHRRSHRGVGLAHAKRGTELLAPEHLTRS